MSQCNSQDGPEEYKETVESMGVAEADKVYQAAARCMQYGNTCMQLKDTCRGKSEGVAMQHLQASPVCC